MLNIVPRIRATVVLHHSENGVQELLKPPLMCAEPVQGVV